jgi:uncharacterized protein YbjQ (UPF0145 family)
MGFQLCTIANDSGLMAMAARGAVSNFRKEVGADAVIAVDLDYNELSTIGSGGGGILLVVANGTAVKLAPAL